MDIKKMLVESIIDRSIQEVSSDPRRAVRRLLDLGLQNTSGGFRAAFLQFSQDVLTDESSPYYSLICNAIRQVDSATLKVMCTNVGYQGWTRGVKRLRASLKETGTALPWQFTFHLDQSSDTQALDRCAALLEAGIRQGIFCYSFLLSQYRELPGELFALLNRYPDCAFFLFLPSTMRQYDPSKFVRLHNAAFFVDAGGTDWETVLTALGGSGCMCNVYRTFSHEADVHDITSGRWLEQVSGLPCICAVTMAAPEADDALCDAVRSYVVRHRSVPTFPVVTADYYSDFPAISQVIVGRPVFFGVGTDGSFTSSDGRREVPASDPLPIVPLQTAVH